jgi:hypothetical protein
MDVKQNKTVIDMEKIDLTNYAAIYLLQEHIDVSDDINNMITNASRIKVATSILQGLCANPNFNYAKPNDAVDLALDMTDLLLDYI